MSIPGIQHHATQQDERGGCWCRVGLFHEYLQCHVIRQGQQLKTELHERLQMIRSEEQEMDVEWTKVRWAAVMYRSWSCHEFWKVCRYRKERFLEF